MNRRRLLWALGPGLMVMLADTDAGSVVTAAQSGARWGYRLLAVQVALVPVLYLVVGLSVRLGVTTGKGLTALVREQLGRRAALLAVALLAVSAVGALVTEFAGIAGVAALYGLPPAAAVLPAAALLYAIVASGGYRRVELIGVALGLFELAFVAAAVLARPGLHALAGGLTAAQPVGDPHYAALLAANVGAVVMPWMLFYQQGAVVDKGLARRDLRAARLDVALGTVLTQVVMGAVLVAAGATLHGRAAGSLRTVGDLAGALTPFLGSTAGRAVLTAGMGGAALVASIVVSLAVAWSVGEALGRRSSLDEPLRAAPLFYGAYAAAIALGVVLVLASGSLVRLALAVEVLNAALLPLLLAALLVLAWRLLPAPALRRRVALAASVMTRLGL